MAEQELESSVKSIKREIKTALIERDMQQAELAKLIDEGVTQVSRAVNGDSSPKSINIRKKIYRVLNIKQ
ncbi:helix-turn-helix domain-containing protein [Paucilactobacillus sp. N302-9]